MTERPRVSILVTDVALPALGHVIELARLLAPHVPVEVVGPDLGKGLSPMYATAWPVLAVPCPRMYRWPEWFRDARRVADACQGDVLIADKAFANTLGIALAEKKRRGKKVAVFLDEWDGAFLSEQSPLRRGWEQIRHLHHPLEACWFAKWEKQLRRADLVIGTTTFLQENFDAQRLDQGVDCQVFRPADPLEVRALKERLGLAGKALVVFGGVARSHKGLAEILDALPPEAHLLVVGPETETVKALKADAARGSRLACTGSVPKAEMPLYLDLADVIALPLRDTPLGQSQMPCKVFEALAMGKPVVATAVSDLPRILEGCGTVVRPDDPEALSRAIAAYLRDPLLASRHRAAARAKALRDFDRPVVSAKLWSMIRPLLD
jgi:glycosyltransferase involved in cell wall biosynthesis